METSQFDDIRPYNVEEIPAAMQRIAFSLHSHFWRRMFILTNLWRLFVSVSQTIRQYANSKRKRCVWSISE